MPDFADEASEITERHIEESLSRIVRYEGVSAKECVECGDEIPLKRQMTIPGCTLCADCQTLKEKGLL